MDNEEIVGKNRLQTLFLKCVQYVLYTPDGSLGMMDKGNEENSRERKTNDVE